MSSRALARASRAVFDGGTAAELLVSLAAIADPHWRGVFDSGDDETQRATALCGRGFTGEVASMGRFGFLNLLGIAYAGDGPHSMSALVQRVRRCDQVRLHLQMLGGGRQQVRELVDDETLRRAVAGDRTARRTVQAALSSGLTVVGATPWLLTAPSPAVKDRVVAALTTWRGARYPVAAERRLRALLHDEAEARGRTLGRTPAEEAVRAVAGGLSYRPPSAPRVVLLVPAPSVRPIVVVVDDVEAHIVVYPPPEARADPQATLLRVTKALGDASRLAILSALRDGDLTAADLSARLGSPRTTLLHHLALLRAAGLLTTTVTPDGTRYARRPAAADYVGGAARSFFDDDTVA